MEISVHILEKTEALATCKSIIENNSGRIGANCEEM
jgi:hypothetical protein